MRGDTTGVKGETTTVRGETSIALHDGLCLGAGCCALDGAALAAAVVAAVRLAARAVVALAGRIVVRPPHVHVRPVPGRVVGGGGRPVGSSLGWQLLKLTCRVE